MIAEQRHSMEIQFVNPPGAFAAVPHQPGFL
jgi:hypothetical protein